MHRFRLVQVALQRASAKTVFSTAVLEQWAHNPNFTILNEASVLFAARHRLRMRTMPADANGLQASKGARKRSSMRSCKGTQKRKHGMRCHCMWARHAENSKYVLVAMARQA